jgi:peptidyl-tRNA hydrolase, PTH1 family
VLRRGASVDWLVVGLGNPGREYARTPHNVGFMVAEALVERWGLGRAKDRFRGRLAEGRVDVGQQQYHSPAVLYSDSDTAVAESVIETSPSPPASVSAPPPARTPAAVSAPLRVAVLCPQTFMNEAGRSVGPARGSFKLPLNRVLVVHDEIDLPFGEVRTRLGGGLAGHNGLKSIKRELGSADFMRVRVGVGRPSSTDPEIVSAHVLGRFRESDAQVAELVQTACEHVEAAMFAPQDQPPQQRSQAPSRSKGR